MSQTQNAVLTGSDECVCRYVLRDSMATSEPRHLNSTLIADALRSRVLLRICDHLNNITKMILYLTQTQSQHENGSVLLLLASV